MARDFRSLSEIAERWGTSHSHVLGLINTGALPATNIGTNPTVRARYIVSVEALEEFESRRSMVTPPPAPKRRRRVDVSKVTEFIK